MPVKFRINARSIVSSTAFALALVAGCSPQSPRRSIPGRRTTPAQGPAPDLKGIEQDLQGLKKAVTLPVIIKPNLPTAPATEPRKPADPRPSSRRSPRSGRGPSPSPGRRSREKATDGSNDAAPWNA